MQSLVLIVVVTEKMPPDISLESQKIVDGIDH